MEIYRLDSSNYKMYNQISGESIIDEECDDNAKSLIAYWLNGYMDDPIINDELLIVAWYGFVEEYEEENGKSPYWEDLIAFLEQYDSPEWIVYEITSYGIACGPVCNTTVYVVEKDVIVEELDDDEMDDEDMDDEDDAPPL